MIKVGKEAYRDYTKATLKKDSEVCGANHLKEFHADKSYSQRMEDDIAEQRELGLKLNRPLTDDNSTWRNMQSEIFEERNITKTG